VEAEASDMENLLGRITKNEKLGEILLVPLWGGSIAAVLFNSLFQNPYPTFLHYLIIFFLCLIAGALMQDIAKALLGFFTAMAVAIAILIGVSSVPAFSALSPEGGTFIESLMIVIIFQSTFPIPFITYLVASMIGALLGDRYLEGSFNLDWTRS